LERLVFDVDAAVTEFTRKGTIGNRTVEELEIREIFLSELCKISSAIFRQCLRRVRLVTVRLQ